MYLDIAERSRSNSSTIFRRNDFISHVREAAQVALEQIGGEDAERAIHITKVLSDEIRILVQEQQSAQNQQTDL